MLLEQADPGNFFPARSCHFSFTQFYFTRVNSDDADTSVDSPKTMLTILFLYLRNLEITPWKMRAYDFCSRVEFSDTTQRVNKT